MTDFIERTKHVLEKKEEQDFGLSIAHTIVKLHGGSIKIMPNEPKGSKVVIKM